MYIYWVQWGSPIAPPLLEPPLVLNYMIFEYVKLEESPSYFNTNNKLNNMALKSHQTAFVESPTGVQRNYSYHAVA